MAGAERRSEGATVPIRYPLTAEGKVLMRLAILMAVMIVAGGSVGQIQAAGGIQLPRFFDPPPPRAQIADAQIWDPYPVPDIGMGPADSARPRDFQYPPPEATRGRVWQGAPGTFPRAQPWLRSQAPVDYPNIRKRLMSSRRTAPPQGIPADEEGPVFEAPSNSAPAREGANTDEVVPARPAKQSGNRKTAPRNNPADF